MCDDDCCGRGREEIEQIEKIKEILGIEKIIERQRDAAEFAEQCLEHLKKIEIPDSHIKQICGFLGEVRVSIKPPLAKDEFHLATPGWFVNGVYVFQLKEAVTDIYALEEEVKKIIQGSRADVIYAFQEFAINFLREKENDEEVGA